MGSGKKTRKVDRAIQDFFNNGLTYLYNGRSMNVKDHAELLTLFLKRMNSEHPNAKYVYEFNLFDGVWCYKIEKHDL